MKPITDRESGVVGAAAFEGCDQVQRAGLSSE